MVGFLVVVVWSVYFGFLGVCLSVFGEVTDGKSVRQKWTLAMAVKWD